jgi:hypothetical protein
MNHLHRSLLLLVIGAVSRAVAFAERHASKGMEVMILCNHLKSKFRRKAISRQNQL